MLETNQWLCGYVVMLQIKWLDDVLWCMIIACLCSLEAINCEMGMMVQSFTPGQLLHKVTVIIRLFMKGTKVVGCSPHPIPSSDAFTQSDFVGLSRLNRMLFLERDVAVDFFKCNFYWIGVAAEISEIDISKFGKIKPKLCLVLFFFPFWWSSGGDDSSKHSNIE